MTTARSEITGAVLGSKLYVIGGFENGRSTVYAVKVYDPIANKWTTVAPLPQPLDHTAASAASFDGKLYVVGGGYLDRDNLSDKLYIYNPDYNNWTQGVNLPGARSAMTANFVDGILYVVGVLTIKKRWAVFWRMIHPLMHGLKSPPGLQQQGNTSHLQLLTVNCML